MKTNNNALHAILQAFSFPSLSTDIITTSIDSSSQYHTFFAPLIAKLAMCGITMKNLVMSQSWLAQQIGCCDRTIRRHLDPLIKLGFIKKRNRGFKKTNEYTINPILKTESVLKLFAPYFHEVALYLSRLAKEKLRIAADVALQKTIIAKQSIGAIMQKGVRLFNNNIYINSKQYCTKDSSIVPVYKKEIDDGKQDFRTKTLKRVALALNLTTAGTIFFAGYTDEVLEKALQAFRNQRCKIKKVFYWFSSVCAALRKQDNSTYNWQKVKDLQKEHNVDDTSLKRTVDVALARVEHKPPTSTLVTPEREQYRQNLFGALLTAIKK